MRGTIQVILISILILCLFWLIQVYIFGIPLFDKQEYGIKFWTLIIIGSLAGIIAALLDSKIRIHLKEKAAKKAIFAIVVVLGAVLFPLLVLKILKRK